MTDDDGDDGDDDDDYDPEPARCCHGADFLKMLD